MSIDQRKCEHAGCRCLVLGDEAFCSAYCKDMAGADHRHAHCDCGHGECEMAADIPLSAVGGA